MSQESPSVIVLAGPNGAGKSTFSDRLFLDWPGKIHYVNADTLARGLSAYHFDDKAFDAGRVMLEHLKKLGKQRADIAFETTLATKSFAPWIADLRRAGYHFGLFFLWIPTAELAIERVYKRKASGGHFVPEETVRRRHQRGIENFFGLYRPQADYWKLWDNTDPENPGVIAEGGGKILNVKQKDLWELIQAKGRK